MPLLFNLRHLEQKNLRLQGELSMAELGLDNLDELVHLPFPLRYDLEVQKLGSNILVQGSLKLALRCECARCLKEFSCEVDLPDWSCHLPLEGEERAAVVNDCVDLTSHIREDMLLEFPQHPLCEPECGGLLQAPRGKPTKSGKTTETVDVSSVWAELDKLKF